MNCDDKIDTLSSKVFFVWILHASYLLWTHPGYCYYWVKPDFDDLSPKVPSHTMDVAQQKFVLQMLLILKTETGLGSKVFFTSLDWFMKY